MITLRDCVDITDLTEDEIDAIAEHEHLPFIVCLEKGSSLLDQDWGDAALRQMALDNLIHARDGQDQRRTVYYQEIYVKTCTHHPGAFDRRHQIRG